MSYHKKKDSVKTSQTIRGLIYTSVLSLLSKPSAPLEDPHVTKQTSPSKTQISQSVSA